LFYAWGEPVWVVLLLLSALVDYLNGLFIEKHRGTRISILGVYITLLFNLGVLATFKYSKFLIENVNALAGTTFSEPSFLLPVGISFYVFMSISYTLDVYRGELKAQRSFPDFLVYIANFHHLIRSVSGKDQEPQRRRGRSWRVGGQWWRRWRRRQWCGRHRGRRRR
jgi:alginate O-acetyltransferase complex protein AlgI